MEIDLDTAKLILENAFADRENYDLKAEDQETMRYFLTSMGVTYAYIFVTGLLGKATNERIDPICLQAGAKRKGAYNARDLCHKVIVPNTDVNPLLGGSNEPFLNKPARIPSLDVQTAFKGEAQKLGVQRMIKYFSKIETTLDALNSLKFCLKTLYDLKAAENQGLDSILQDLSKTVEEKNNRIIALNFYKEVLKASCEGETLVLCVHTALINYFNEDKGFTVDTHPSNESGASSKEIEDIDLYFQGKPYCCLELKDKPYDVPDIRKSLGKIIAQKVPSLLFVEGINAQFIGKKEKLIDFLTAAKKIGINIQIVPVLDFLAFLTTLTPGIDIIKIVEEGRAVSRTIRTKKKTIENWGKIASLLLKEKF